MLTSLDFLNTGEPWPPTQEQNRMTRYRDSRYLFDGEHQRVFSDWVRLIRHDESAALEFVLNYPKRLSTLWADLLLGEPPRFRAGEEESPEQEAVDRLVRDNQLVATAYQVMLDVSSYGDGLFKIGLNDDNEAVIDGQVPTFWYPIVSEDDVKDVQAHVLAWTVTRSVSRFIGDPAEEVYLRVQIHERGRVENRIYRIDDNGSIGRQIPIEQWDDELAEEWQTGIDEFLIQHVPNLQTTASVFGRDDYSDIFSILQEMAVRVGQISRVLDKHADPSMYGDPNQITVDPATGGLVFEGGGRFFQVTEGESPPGYITWDGQLQAAFEEFDLLQKQLYTLSETSPAAFGQMDRVYAESGTALRRLMMVPLAKVNRMRLFADPGLSRVIRTALALEAANSGPGPALESLEIEWHDGLPDDPRELAEIEKIRVEAGNTSTYSSISRLDGGTDTSIREEIDRIRDGMAADAATVVGSAPPLNLQFGGEDES